MAETERRVTTPGFASLEEAVNAHVAAAADLYQDHPSHSGRQEAAAGVAWDLVCWVRAHPDLPFPVAPEPH